MNKSNKEIVSELVSIVFEKIGSVGGGNGIMLMPVISMAKVKMAQMDDADCDSIVDYVHQISHLIEKETGTLSPYHGLEDFAIMPYESNNVSIP